MLLFTRQVLSDNPPPKGMYANFKTLVSVLLQFTLPKRVP